MRSGVPVNMIRSYARVTVSEWRQFLQHYSDELVSSGDDVLDVPIAADARARRWMGFEPVPESAIEAAEQRLGRRLPPSLRNFFRVSNGWRQTGFFIYDVLPVEEIGWLKDRQGSQDALLYQMACENEVATGPWKDDPDDVRLHEYQHDQGTRLKRSLVISSWGDAAVWLLDPGPPSHDGEWPGGCWASWNPGMVEWDAESFADLMRHELDSFVSLRDQRA
jgi:hypothetical protein